jgi:hypothetical protein
LGEHFFAEGNAIGANRAVLQLDQPADFFAALAAEAASLSCTAVGR